MGPAPPPSTDTAVPATGYGEGVDVASPDLDPAVDDLVRLLVRGRRVVALTGAGVSTASGIPDYRDDAGAWKRRPPVHLAEYLAGESVRRRYWARSVLGWPAFAAAGPNAAHDALARLEASGRVDHLVTQNVDGLHQKAGSRRVLDLHGRLHEVECLSCGAREDRDAVQSRLLAAHPHVAGWTGRAAPDGDADLEGEALASFRPPECLLCGGVLKPSVVFFGESVPPARVAQAYARVAEADAILVVGTSLQVFSGFRFVRAAADRGVPIAIVNRGSTRGDALATVRVRGPCGPVLATAAARMGA